MAICKLFSRPDYIKNSPHRRLLRKRKQNSRTSFFYPQALSLSGRASLTIVTAELFMEMEKKSEGFSSSSQAEIREVGRGQGKRRPNAPFAMPVEIVVGVE